MSREAMKLALEALECKDGWGSSVRVLKEKAVTSLRTSLSSSKIEGDLMQRFYDGEEAKSLISEAEETITALREALANEALDRMAENARELGLDYEPAQQTIHCKHRRENNGICPHHNLHCGWPKCNEPEQPAQEPVAWQVMVEDEAMKEFSTKDIAHDWCVQQKLSGSSYTYWLRPLYTRPQAREWVAVCEYCENERPVIHAPAREWVGLTDDEIHDIYDEVASREPYNMAVTRRNISRAIEAKLKEKNT